MPELTLSQQFQDFLANTPEALKRLLEIIEIYASQLPANVTTPTNPPQGPQPAVEGATYELITQPLSQSDIDALTEGTADAVVMERLHARIKGFFNAVMVGAL